MTREKTDAALSSIAERIRDKDTLGALVILLDVVGALHERLVAVEPCPAAPVLYEDKRHAWDGNECSRCKTIRTP